MDKKSPQAPKWSSLFRYAANLTKETALKQDKTASLPSFDEVESSKHHKTMQKPSQPRKMDKQPPYLTIHLPRPTQHDRNRDRKRALEGEEAEAAHRAKAIANRILCTCSICMEGVASTPRRSNSAPAPRGKSERMPEKKDWVARAEEKSKGGRGNRKDAERLRGEGNSRRKPVEDARRGRAVKAAADQGERHASKEKTEYREKTEHRETTKRRDQGQTTAAPEGSSRTKSGVDDSRGRLVEGSEHRDQRKTAKAEEGSSRRKSVGDDRRGREVKTAVDKGGGNSAAEKTEHRGQRRVTTAEEGTRRRKHVENDMRGRVVEDPEHPEHTKRSLTRKVAFGLVEWVCQAEIDARLAERHRAGESSKPKPPPAKGILRKPRA